jgi:hypothetical protein
MQNIPNPKIELIEEQINNLEKSGFFTEKEMDRLCAPLRLELEIINSEISTKKDIK